MDIRLFLLHFNMKIVGDGIEYNFIVPFVFLNAYYLFNICIMCKFYLLNINVKCIFVIYLFIYNVNKM